MEPEALAVVAAPAEATDVWTAGCTGGFEDAFRDEFPDAFIAESDDGDEAG